MMEFDRRGVLAGTFGSSLVLSSTAWANHRAPGAMAGRLLDAADFGTTGDGRADDGAALQQAFDALLVENHGGVLVIPPGTYRVSRAIRIEPPEGRSGNVTGGCTIRAHGARLVSDIRDGSPVIEIVSRSIMRFVTIEGLEIRGSRSDGHGLALTCVKRGSYIYNFCLRDIVIQNCGGDGCRMTGNLFEGQLFNCYFRDNGGNGATFAHGPEDTVLSAVHAFGCVFGGNRIHGVEMADGAEDVGFQGCYFLLNGKYGLSASHGCTLLSHCGFENNHRSAGSFDDGDAGVRLLVKGLLVGCTAYSIEYQTHLLHAYLTQDLVMIGCSAGGAAKAQDAGLARFKGNGNGEAILVGTRGRIDNEGGVEVLNLGAAAAGRFPSKWADPDLVRLGDYRLWVDAFGRLRMKNGRPTADDDGEEVGG